jgi:hypothetical protein
LGSKGDECSVAEVKRMIMKIFNDLKEELKGEIQNSSMNPMGT